MHRIVSEYKIGDNSNSNIRVYIRARPNEDETEPGDFLKVAGDEGRMINIKDPDPANQKYSEVAFEFDKIFWTQSKQEEIFDSMCKPQVEHVLNGFNCCCFAYGQTGSGKTYSMFGYDAEVRGIIPRSAEYLFKCLETKSTTAEIAVVCSFLEIYNDSIRDLGKAYLVSIGAESSSSKALFHKTSDIYESLAGKRGNPYFAPAFYNSSPTKAGSKDEAVLRGYGYKEVIDEYNAMNYEIREDAEGNVFVQNLSMVPVTTIEEVMSMIETGLKVRATHETKMNATSSRSHTIFTLSVLQRDKVTDITVNGMLNLVDLAGSERLKKSESVGIRLKEALHINTSLSALGKVIMSLDPNSENTHVPYRDAKLTRVLQNSLGGNSYTIVLAAIHPHPNYYDECLSTLQFANRCRNVKNHPRVNYVDDPADKDLRIKRLQEEIAVLRTKVTQYEKTGGKMIAGEKKLQPAKLVELLKKLGVQADLAADGALMVNGQRHELEDLGLHDEEEGEDEGDDFGGGENGPMGDTDFDAVSGVPGWGQSLGNMNKKKLKRIILELQEANRNHSVKSKERKVLMQEQGKQIEDLSRQVSRLQLAVKKHDLEMQTQKENMEFKAEEGLKHLEEVHRREVDKMIQLHDAENKRQMEVFASAPVTFKNYTALIRQKEEEKKSYEGPLRDEFRNQLALIQRTNDAELENVKKQSAYFLKEKENALQALAEKFNEYKAKKAEQLKMCEQEIIKMFEYMNKIDDILDNVERGVYNVEQYQGPYGNTTTGLAATLAGAAAGAGTAAVKGKRDYSVPDATSMLTTLKASTEIYGGPRIRGRVLLPQGLRPQNPLRRPEEMHLARKIVEKYTQRKEQLAETRKMVEAKTALFTQKMSASASALNINNPESEMDPSVEQHLEELVGPIKQAKASNAAKVEVGAAARGRPSTAAPKRSTQSQSGGSQQVHRPGSAIGHRANTASLAANRSMSPDRRDSALSGSGSLSLWRRKQTSPNATAAGISRRSIMNDEEVASEEVAQLKQEIVELRNQVRVDQQLIAGISSNEMVQYIQQLEEENAELHRKLRTANTDMRNTKAVNTCLLENKQIRPSTTTGRFLSTTIGTSALESSVSSEVLRAGTYSKISQQA